MESSSLWFRLLVGLKEVTSSSVPCWCWFRIQNMNDATWQLRRWQLLSLSERTFSLVLVSATLNLVPLSFKAFSNWYKYLQHTHLSCSQSIRMWSVSVCIWDEKSDTHGGLGSSLSRIRIVFACVCANYTWGVRSHVTGPFSSLSLMEGG